MIFLGSSSCSTEQEEYNLIFQLECDIQFVRDKSLASAVVRETEGSLDFFSIKGCVL